MSEFLARGSNREQPWGGNATAAPETAASTAGARDALASEASLIEAVVSEGMVSQGVAAGAGQGAAAAPEQGAEERQLLHQLYGPRHAICPVANADLTLVLSLDRDIDLIELEALCDAVGWSRRPLRRVRKALQHSLLCVGLWRHHPRVPRLVGFARCTGDGIVEATIWDVAVHPLYQGAGLGRQLMVYVLEELRGRGIDRVSLFADPGVVGFYQAQGWQLEPLDRRCAFWYAP